jgi:hypothetical protein
MRENNALCISLWVVLFLSISAASFAQVPDSPERTQLLASDQPYKHPLGFTFLRPNGWQVQETQEGISLVPPDGAGESCVIIAEPVEGISRPDDPGLIQALDEQLTAMAPFLQRVGAIDPIQTDNGPGVRLTWEGRNPDTQAAVRSHIFITLFKEHVVYFITTGATAQIEARKGVLLAIFSTFGFSGAPPGISAGNPLASANPLAAADPYIGSFKSDQIQIEFNGSGGAYRGNIHFGGQRFPFEARKVGQAIQGTFQSQGTPFEFTASLNGTKLTFSTGGTIYALEKEMSSQPANPLATNPLAGQPSVNPSLKQRQGGKTYTHPIGFTFWYPEQWQAQETEAGIQLAPPDVSANAQGPTEVYLVTGESAEGVERPDDPRFVQYLDSQLRTLLPFMQRTGEVEALQTPSGPGALITWEGKNPTGMLVRARVFAVILKGYGVALVALGDKERINSREPALREVFLTFGLGEAKRDPRFIGVWRSESYYSSGDFSSASVRYMTFQPDGTFSSGGRLMFSSDAGTGDTGDSDGERGRWAAANDKVYLMWDNGSYAEYGYYIQGQPGSQEMLFKPTNGGKNELWTQVK